MLSYKPANGLAREDETASPGTNVSSSISIPNRSKSRLAPKANVVFKAETSFLTSVSWIMWLVHTERKLKCQFMILSLTNMYYKVREAYLTLAKVSSSSFETAAS